MTFYRPSVSFRPTPLTFKKEAVGIVRCRPVSFFHWAKEAQGENLPALNVPSADPPETPAVTERGPWRRECRLCAANLLLS